MTSGCALTGRAPSLNAIRFFRGETYGERGIVDATMTAALAILALSLVLALYRVARGPSLADRVAALDLVVFISIGLTAGIAVLLGEEELLDVALVIALTSFIVSIAAARFLERRRQLGSPP